MRKENNGIRYFSFTELPTQNTKTKKKNNDDLRERFEKRHTCPICHEPMTWIEGTNICACKNPECKGKKIEKKNEDGTAYVEYKPYYHMLDVVGTEIAEKIYSED